MVVLNKIYTKTGDGGETALGNGERLAKDAPRIAAYGTVDETNACLGLVRLHTKDPVLKELDDVLGRIQNELFDLGADLCVPETGEPLSYEPLRITAAQASQLERDIDHFNRELSPLRSFILPGGEAASAFLHLARTVCRRAERLIVTLQRQAEPPINTQIAIYMNRLSDFLFVASRWVNHRKETPDHLWVPGKTRQ